MADNAAGGQGQDSTAQGQQQGQEPAAQQGQQQGAGQAPGQQQQAQGQQGQEFNLDTITDPALRAYVEGIQRRASEANQEAARYRTERNQFQQQVTDYQRQNETEQQRAEREQAERQAEFDRLAAENRALKLGNQWTVAAGAAKALDPVALLNLIGGADKIEMGEDGKATNLEALLTEAKASYPWAFSRTAGADAGQGGDGAGASQGSMNDWIRGRR